MVYALISDMKLDGKRIAGFQPKNDDYLQIEVEDSTPDGGMRVNHGRALVSGRRIKLDHVPTQMKLDGGTLIADYTSYNGFLCVTDKFKAVVEAVEPGVHQFSPFEVVGAAKKHIADMWIMIVCNRLDSVDREHTTLALYRGVLWQPAREVPREYWPPNVGPDTPSRLYFNISQIGNNHLWFDKHLSDDHPLASGKLITALKEADVSGVSFNERRAV